MNEQTFQGAVRLAVTKHLHARVELHRQPAGKILARIGGAVDCAPVGAADLSGIVKGPGYRLEVELKMPKGKRTEDQVRWAENMTAWGAVYVLVTYVAALELEANVARALTLIELAIADREARPC